VAKKGGFHFGIITVIVSSSENLFQVSTRLRASPSIAFARDGDRRGPQCVSILMTPAPCSSVADSQPLHSLPLSLSLSLLQASTVTFAQSFNPDENDNSLLSSRFSILSTFWNELFTIRGEL